MKDSIYKVISLYLLIIICLVSTLLPFIWMLSTSFKHDNEIFTKEPVFFPEKPTLDHYKTLFLKVNFFHYFKNSIIIAVGLTLLSIFINSLAAFAFAKQNFPGKEKNSVQCPFLINFPSVDIVGKGKQHGAVAGA